MIDIIHQLDVNPFVTAHDWQMYEMDIELSLRSEATRAALRDRSQLRIQLVPPLRLQHRPQFQSQEQEIRHPYHNRSVRSQEMLYFHSFLANTHRWNSITKARKTVENHAFVTSTPATVAWS